MCYVDICFGLNIKESSNNDTNIQESYFSKKETLSSFKEIQQQISFGKFFKIMWKGMGVKSSAYFTYLLIWFLVT